MTRQLSIAGRAFRGGCKVSRRRPRTVANSRVGKKALERGRVLLPVTDHHRPRTRRDCEDMERPCPYVSCRYHLYLDVDEKNGSIKFPHPDIDPLDLPQTCALDVADDGPISLEEIGAILNVSRERARQIESIALRRITRRHGAKLTKDFRP